MNVKPNGLSAAMSTINDCKGCQLVQKDAELRNQTSGACINTSSSANSLSPLQNLVSQVILVFTTTPSSKFRVSI